MYKSNFKLGIFMPLLLIVMGMTACEKQSVSPCDLTTERMTQYDVKDIRAVLFKSQPPETFIGTSYIQRDETKLVIVGTIPQYLICNFPDYAKKWDIPENGLPVIINGNAYEHIFENIDTGGKYVATCDLSLTSFKKL
jgi:hypothetical protein